MFLGLLGHVVVPSLLRPGPRLPSLRLRENSRAGPRHRAGEAQPGLEAAYEAASIFFLEVSQG